MSELDVRTAEGHVGGNNRGDEEDDSLLKRILRIRSSGCLTRLAGVASPGRARSTYRTRDVRRWAIPFAGGAGSAKVAGFGLMPPLSPILAGMTTSTKAAIVLGALCLLLAGVLIGSRMGASPESERYYARANRVPDAVAPASAAPAQSSGPDVERNQFIEDVKTIDFAALQCAADHSDVMPGPDEFAPKVRPYMDKTKPDRLDAFRWAFKGGKETQAAAPEKTEIGRLVGETGSAIAYLDGHAEWKRN